ncbi:unnamed protein product [Phaeothamnion confervicola]
MRRGAALAIAIVVTVAVVTVASFSGDSSNGLLTDVHEKPKPMALFEASETSSVGSLSFTTHNAYTERAPITWWRQVQGAPAVWKHLAEPYKESTFTAVLEDSAAAADGRAGSIYSWDVDGTRYQGASIAHTFNKVGHYGVQLTCLDATTGKVIDSIQDTVRKMANVVFPEMKVFATRMQRRAGAPGISVGGLSPKADLPSNDSI